MIIWERKGKDMIWLVNHSKSSEKDKEKGNETQLISLEPLSILFA